MTQEVFANNASTTLGSSLTSGATSCTVATGTGNTFPAIGAGEFFSATLFAAGNDTGIPNEIVYVTARSGDSMTILRGQEGTTPQAWAVGDTFANYPTAGFLNSLLQTGQLQQQSTNSADDTGAANAGVIALTPAPLAMSGLLLAPIRVLKTNADNTGAYTLNVNGLGALPVTLGGHPLEAGQLLGSRVFEVVYNGTAFELISVPGSIDNINLADMPSATVKANITGAGAKPVDVDLAVFAAALPALAGGFVGNQSFTIGGLTICVHDFTITGATTINVPHGNSWVYNTWGRCLMAGDDSNNDVSTACVGWSTTYGRIYSHASGSVSCWLFSIGQ